MTIFLSVIEPRKMEGDRLSDQGGIYSAEGARPLDSQIIGGRSRTLLWKARETFPVEGKYREEGTPECAGSLLIRPTCQYFIVTDVD